MAFCIWCGKQIEEGQICSCTIPKASSSNSPRFFMSMLNRMGIGDQARNATDRYERGQLIVPNNIKSNEGETHVKQYDVAVLRSLLTFERAEGRMQVTNKRLIFRAPGRSIGGRTTLQHEYAIDEIAGIEARRNYRFSLIHLIGGLMLYTLTGAIGSAITTWVSSKSPGLGVIMYLLLIAAGMIAFFMIPKEFALKLAVLGLSGGSLVLGVLSITQAAPMTFLLNAIGDIIVSIVSIVCLFLFFMRPNLVISIKNKMGMGEGPIDIRRKTLKSESTGFSEVIPTDEAEYAIREIGAIIGDIQKLGDLGIGKWTQQ